MEAGKRRLGSENCEIHGAWSRLTAWLSLVLLPEPMFLWLPSSLHSSHTDHLFCSLNLPSLLQPQGLGICCPLCLDCPSPPLDSRPALLIFRVSVQCHLLPEALLHLIPKGGTPLPPRHFLTPHPAFLFSAIVLSPWHYMFKYFYL